MIAQCWLHIGTEKTGSTSIQTFLAQNRAPLLSRGWIYPQAAGARKHHSLVATSLDDDRSDGTRRMLGIGDRIGIEDFRHHLLNALETELAASGATTAVFSSELLGTRLRSPGEIGRLKALCDDLASHTRVVVYIRNQADFLVSRYTNVIWEGGTEDFAFRARAAIADYGLLLNRWSQMFGRENVIVRRFESADFVGNDLIADFADAVGLDVQGMRRTARSNPSLDAEALAFLRALNRRLPRGRANRVDRFRGALVRVLQRRGGTKFVIARTLSQRIEEAYRQSNERVSAEYFASRFRPLFSPPALVAADDTTPNGISAFTAMRVAGFLGFGLLREGVIWAGKRLLRR
jgi:hypothetical protein